MSPTMLETSNESIVFTFLTISQVFCFQRYEELHIRANERWVLKVNDGPIQQSSFHVNDTQDRIRIYPVRLIELD